MPVPGVHRVIANLARRVHTAALEVERAKAMASPPVPQTGPFRPGDRVLILGSRWLGSDGSLEWVPEVSTLAEVVAIIPGLIPMVRVRLLRGAAAGAVWEFDVARVVRA